MMRKRTRIHKQIQNNILHRILDLGVCNISNGCHIIASMMCLDYIIVSTVGNTYQMNNHQLIRTYHV